MFNRFIEIPIYRGQLGLIISDSVDDIRQIIPEFETDEIYASTYYHDKDDKGTMSIILNFNNKTKIKHGTIAHECYHVVSMIFETRGVKADWNNDEPGAYLIDWVFNKIMEWLKEAKIEL